MAFDAQVEDWQRMGMRLARTLDAGDPFGSVRAAVSFGHRYASDRDSLPQTNSERAFRLVAQATELIDYELPFAEPARADRIITEARGMLEQARTLDPHCHDAARMIAAQDRPSFDEFYHYLTEGDAAVRAGCERARDAVNLPDPQACRLARDLAFLPYLRWLATEASRALICGRYRKAIEHATELARLDENGIADADLTLAIAHTKLEDQAALDELAARGGGPMGNAWLALATLAMAYKRRDMSAATQVTSQIIAKWPHAALTLELQDELPDGVFSRIVVERVRVLDRAAGGPRLQRARFPGRMAREPTDGAHPGRARRPGRASRGSWRPRRRPRQRQAGTRRLGRRRQRRPRQGRRALMHAWEELVERCAEKRSRSLGGLSDAAFLELETAVRANPERYVDDDAEAAFLEVARALDRVTESMADDDLRDDDDYMAERARRNARLADDCRRALTLDAGCVDAQVLLALATKTDDAMLDAVGAAMADGGATSPDADELARWDDPFARPRIRATEVMSRLLLQTGRIGAARDLCGRLVDADPSDPTGARYTLALAHARMEDEDALDTFNLARMDADDERSRNPFADEAELEDAGFEYVPDDEVEADLADDKDEY